MSVTILLYIDALRCDYITQQNTPFLHSTNNANFVAPVCQTQGFCERFEVFTGEHASKYKLHFATAIDKRHILEQSNSVVNRVKQYYRYFQPKSRVFRKILRTKSNVKPLTFLLHF